MKIPPEQRCHHSRSSSPRILRVCATLCRTGGRMSGARPSKSCRTACRWRWSRLPSHTLASAYTWRPGVTFRGQFATEFGLKFEVDWKAFFFVTVGVATEFKAEVGNIEGMELCVGSGRALDRASSKLAKSKTQSSLVKRFLELHVHHRLKLFKR